MKNELIDKTEAFDKEENSIFLYEDKMLDVINKRILELKNLNSNDWSSFSDSSYELFRAYEFLIEALEICGKSSKSIVYAKDAIEYLMKYQMYLNKMDMKKFSDCYMNIIKKYKVELW